MKYIAAGLLIAALTSCGGGDVRFADISSIEFDHAFAVRLRGDIVVDQQGPFSPDEVIRVDAEPSDDLVLVSFSDADLAAASEMYEQERSAELRLISERAEPGCETGKLVSGNRAQLPLPDRAAIRTIDTGGGSITFAEPTDTLRSVVSNSVLLELPVATNRCTGLGAFEPVASEPIAVPAGAQLGGGNILGPGLLWRDLLRVDENRVLASVGGVLMVIDRRASEQPTSAAVLPLGSVINGIAIDDHPDRRIDSKTRVVAVGQAVFEFLLGPDSLELVGSSTRTFPLDDVVIEPETGMLVAAGRNGYVLIQARRGAALDSVRPIADESGNNGIIELTHRPDAPFLLSSYDRAVMLVGSPDARTWTPYTEGLDPSVRYKAAASSSVGRLWAGGNLGRLSTRGPSDSSWSDFDRRLPPELEACRSGPSACGWHLTPLSYGRIESAESPQRRLFMTVNECNIVVSARQDGACASYRTIDSPTLRRVENDRSYRHLHAAHGFLTVLSQDGELYEAEITP